MDNNHRDGFPFYPNSQDHTHVLYFLMVLFSEHPSASSISLSSSVSIISSCSWSAERNGRLLFSQRAQNICCQIFKDPSRHSSDIALMKVGWTFRQPENILQSQRSQRPENLLYCKTVACSYKTHNCISQLVWGMKWKAKCGHLY